jgi:hypothetical protein
MARYFNMFPERHYGYVFSREILNLNHESTKFRKHEEQLLFKHSLFRVFILSRFRVKKYFFRLDRVRG